MTENTLETEPHENAIPSLARFADEAANLIRAAGELFESELALSRQSLHRLAAGALLLPLLAGSLWLALHGLLIAALQALGCGWIGALAIDIGLQLGLFFLLLRALRRWLYDMSFPNSRRVVQQVQKWFS